MSDIKDILILSTKFNNEVQNIVFELLNQLYSKYLYYLSIAKHINTTSLAGYESGLRRSYDSWPAVSHNENSISSTFSFLINSSSVNFNFAMSVSNIVGM